MATPAPPCRARVPPERAAPACRTLSTYWDTAGRIAPRPEHAPSPRTQGDFDGAIDLVVEPTEGSSGRVRVVRAEMEPVFRRLTNGGRRQVAPLVKVTSEAGLLKRLAADLEEFI